MSTLHDHRTGEMPATRATADTTTSRGFDPSLVVAILAGALALFTLVVGLVTVARTGFSADITAATTVVGPFDRSLLMGLVEIVAGISLAGVAASRRSASLTGFGLLATVFGLVYLIEPQAFGDALGVDRATAVTYLLLGLASAGIGLWAPDEIVVRRR